ncbi:hypothetical protein KFE94_14690 [bacterium SCSIO 12643]|nr:hypothetical protein KFE94_14690 [bacterium SCSIO 12643]
MVSVVIFAAMTKYFYAILSISLLLFTYSCKKDLVSTDPNAKLAFSTDTLAFDTVFTQMGSATHRFMIYNRNSETVIISNIKLKGGSTSNFRLNVNGQPGITFNDIEIKGNDSIFVFAEVTIDPTNANNPFVIFDAVEFTTNGNEQQVVLSAWGQNAYYYRPNLFINGLPPISHISDYPDYFPIGNTVNLPNDKPHVIFGFLMIDSAITLNIPSGTKLHFYDKSGMWAYRGSTLNVNGSPGNEVIFQGTRLEDFYDDQPGQWDRIILNEGPQDHTFNNVIIKNSFIGIQAEEFYLDGVPALANNKVKLYNTTIQNSRGLGMLIRNHNIIADNVLVANSGNILVAIQGAGTHRFRHTTIANFWRFGTRSDETLLLSNYFGIPASGGGQVEIAGDLDVRMDNCIIYGTNDEELATDSVASAQFNYLFQNCVLKTEKDTLDTGLTGKFKNIVLNPSTPNSFAYNNPLFVDPYKDDFLLSDSSRAIDKGDLNLTDTLLMDLKGDMRDNLPDLGAYEF